MPRGIPRQGRWPDGSGPLPKVRESVAQVSKSVWQSGCSEGHGGTCPDGVGSRAASACISMRLSRCLRPDAPCREAADGNDRELSHRLFNLCAAPTTAAHCLSQPAPTSQLKSRLPGPPSVARHRPAMQMLPNFGPLRQRAKIENAGMGCAKAGFRLILRAAEILRKPETLTK